MTGTLRSTLLAFALLLLATPAPAHATANFPAAVQQYVGADGAPACLLCHDTALGGLGTVRTPFGLSMVAEGLIAYDLSRLEAALEAAERNGQDSDDDGIDDIDELARGDDPNVATASQTGRSASGCSLALTSQHLAWTFLGLVLVAVRRRRSANRVG